MSQKIRRELCERLHFAVVEAEAAFWNKLKEQFPEAQGVDRDMNAAIVASLWTALDAVSRAWALEHVPGMVEALANERADLGGPVRDERDQT